MTIEEQLRRDEGVRLKPYKDTVGKLTIGIGRNLDDVGISLEEAEIMLANDISKVDAKLKAALPWTDRMDRIRYAVLENMAFNMGVAGLLEFRQTLALIEDGKYAEAAKEMLNSHWAKQVGDRAIRLSLQLDSGEWK